MSTAKEMMIDSTTYLEGEKIAEFKSEYLKGEVFAMVGVSSRHAMITGNIFAELRHLLKGKPCQPFVADMKVHVSKADAYFYPDVFVTPEDRTEKHDYFKEHPCLIVEVLSKSTEAFDRGEKIACYRQLASLIEYWLVDPKSLTIDQFFRNDDDTWQLRSVSIDTHQNITVLSLYDLKITLTDIFDGVTERKK